MRVLQAETSQRVDSQIKALQAEIFRLEGVRWALVKSNPIDGRISYREPPPELSQSNIYWHELSKWLREEKQWNCEKCCISLEERQYDLHVHHIFGRGFNSPQHLKVLCIACHAEEHPFMKAYPEYKAFLEWKKKADSVGTFDSCLPYRLRFSQL